MRIDDIFLFVCGRVGKWALSNSAALSVAMFDCSGVDSGLVLDASLERWPGPRGYAVLMWCVFGCDTLF